MIIYAATKKYLLDVPVDDILDFEHGFLEYMKTQHPDVAQSIREAKEIVPKTEEKLQSALESYKKEFKKEDSNL